MKRKNDRSAKVVLVTSSIVTILVGVSVFSLYSLSKGDEGDTLSIETEESVESTNSKLLSKMDESADVVVANAAPVEEAALAAETIVSEYSQPLAVLAVTSTTVDSIEVPGSDNYAEPVASVASVQTTDFVQDTMVDTVVYEEPVYQETADYTSYEDTAVYEETAEFSYSDESYTEPSYAEYAWDDSSENETDIVVVDSVVEETESYDAAESYDADGEWVYDYDTEEWVYVYYNDTDDSSDYSYDQEDSSEDWTDDGGEWVYDYDIEEWVYVYNNDTNDSSDESYDQEDTSDDWSDDGGEWVYDYDIEEWVYVYNNDNNDSSDESYDQEDTSDDWTDDGGEWVYDYDIEEWVYVYNNDTDDSIDESYDQEDTSEDWTDDSDSYDYDDSYDNSLGQQIVNYAMNFVGYTPYVWAGRSLDSGTDCSGFVNLIYADFGIYCSAASLAYDGSSFGYIISQDELQPGDIVVYGGGDHVAIYAGDGYVVHCSSPENGTVYWNMYYRSDISWFLRVL